MNKKDIIKNSINHYINRIEELKKYQKLGLHDYTISINYYKNKINQLLEEL